jgi:hypothetical protein
MTRRYTGAMKLLQATLLTLACALPAAGFAQWQWIDKDGRKVFSDRPPPQDTPEKNILKQPGGGIPRSAPAPVAAAPAEGTPAATTTAAASATKPAASAPGTGKDKALEEKKAQAEAAEAAKKKAD